MLPVNSSAVVRIEWKSGTLSIWFKESGRYDFPGVAEYVYLSFMHARSKGAFCNNDIKDRHQTWSMVAVRDPLPERVTV